MRQGRWHVAGLADGALMSCGNPCLLGRGEIVGLNRCGGRLESVRWAFGHADVGGLNDFHFLTSWVKFGGGFRHLGVFFFFFLFASTWRIGYEGELFSLSPVSRCHVILRRDRPGAVPFDNEQSASPDRRFCGSDVGSHRSNRGLPTGSIHASDHRDL